MDYICYIKIKLSLIMEEAGSVFVWLKENLIEERHSLPTVCVVDEPAKKALMR